MSIHDKRCWVCNRSHPVTHECEERRVRRVATTPKTRPMPPAALLARAVCSASPSNSRQLPHDGMRSLGASRIDGVVPVPGPTLAAGKPVDAPMYQIEPVAWTVPPRPMTRYEVAAALYAGKTLAYPGLEYRLAADGSLHWRDTSLGAPGDWFRSSCTGPTDLANHLEPSRFTVLEADPAAPAQRTSTTPTEPTFMGVIRNANDALAAMRTGAWVRGYFERGGCTTYRLVGDTLGIRSNERGSWRYKVYCAIDEWAEWANVDHVRWELVPRPWAVEDKGEAAPSGIRSVRYWTSHPLGQLQKTLHMPNGCSLESLIAHDGSGAEMVWSTVNGFARRFKSSEVVGDTLHLRRDGGHWSAAAVLHEQWRERGPAMY